MSTQSNILTYAQREAYRRDILNIPSPIDEWLISNARSPWIAFLKVYLMLNEVEAEYVTCRVDMDHVTIAGIQVYRFPDRLLSPRVMLDFFAGGKDDIAAPNWTQWSNPSLVFQQPSLNFAQLFARMATWPLNLANNVPDMFPSFTPERPLRPVENTQTHKPRASMPRAALPRSSVPTEVAEATAIMPMKFEPSDD
ncbi:hypothetical protein FIBSPDRAFT_902037 [Athelia psychrophila]|uniref:Uncharacterized protein n=1 Tax=Athelia psychrophila TaxID=1759441 RepID=A0A167XQC5_9AGAM|nr:hypothetical protein FIBSPDRAFT_902037 [Fibularhizoctonia sp. CBS 109695]